MNITNAIIAKNTIKITKIISFIFCSKLSGVLVVVGRVVDPVRGRPMKNE